MLWVSLVWTFDFYLNLPYRTVSRSEVDSANHYTIEASYKKGQIFHVESYNVLLFGRVKIQNACLL